MHRIELLAPYRGRDKWELIAAHRDLPLHLTVTCEDPMGMPEGELGPLQCGACIKCKERHDAFLQAGVPDPTRYAVPMA
jgi:7-cyano-7-deazaguanine synthase in queuosine biosynthesis